MTEFLLALAGAAIVVAMGFAVFVGMQVARLERQLNAAERELDWLRNELGKARANAEGATNAPRSGGVRDPSTGVMVSRSLSRRRAAKKSDKEQG